MFLIGIHVLTPSSGITPNEREDRYSEEKRFSAVSCSCFPPRARLPSYVPCTLSLSIRSFSLSYRNKEKGNKKYSFDTIFAPKFLCVGNSRRARKKRGGLAKWVRVVLEVTSRGAKEDRFSTLRSFLCSFFCPAVVRRSVDDSLESRDSSWIPLTFEKYVVNLGGVNYTSKPLQPLTFECLFTARNKLVGICSVCLNRGITVDLKVPGCYIQYIIDYRCEDWKLVV
jgi:hypothetical protein